MDSTSLTAEAYLAMAKTIMKTSIKHTKEILVKASNMRIKRAARRRCDSPLAHFSKNTVQIKGCR